jgi:hypothetical protein
LVGGDSSTLSDGPVLLLGGRAPTGCVAGCEDDFVSNPPSDVSGETRGSVELPDLATTGVGGTRIFGFDDCAGDVEDFNRGGGIAPGILVSFVSGSGRLSVFVGPGGGGAGETRVSGDVDGFVEGLCLVSSCGGALGLTST